MTTEEQRLEEANDMTTDDTYFERGINLRHGYMSEYYVDDAEFIVKPFDSRRRKKVWTVRPHF